MSRAAAPAIAATLLVAGCGPSYQEFEPTERLTALTPHGYVAAEYELDTREGELGEAKVWSDGAYDAKVDGRRSTVIEVQMEIENTSEEPLYLTEMKLDSLSVEGYRLENVQPARIDGPNAIGPDQEVRVRAYFALPSRIELGDIEAFRIKWSLQKDGVTYRQRTPFLARPNIPPAAPGYYYYYTPYYDPFLYDPFYHPGLYPHRYPYRYRYYYYR